MSYESVGINLGNSFAAGKKFLQGGGAPAPDEADMSLTDKSLKDKVVDWAKSFFGGGTPSPDTRPINSSKAIGTRVVDTSTGSRVVSGGVSQTTMLVGAAALVALFVVLKKKR